MAAVALAMFVGACSGNSPKSRYVLAERLFKDEKYAAAVKEFEKVIAKDAKGELGLQALIRAAVIDNLYLQNYASALRRYGEYLDRAGDTELAWEARKQIGEILFSKTEQYELSARHYRQMLALKPKHEDVPFYRFRVAKSFFQLSRWDEAIAEFGEIIKQHPKGEWAERAHFEIAQTLYTRGGNENYQEALDQYRRFLVKYPNSRRVPEAKFGIAACLEEVDQLEAAYHQFEEIKKTHPSPKVVEIRLVRIKERQTQKSR